MLMSSDVVRMKLNKLKLNKAPDIDSVGTRMLIELATEISETIADRLI